MSWTIVPQEKGGGGGNVMIIRIAIILDQSIYTFHIIIALNDPHLPENKQTLSTIGLENMMKMLLCV